MNVGNAPAAGQLVGNDIEQNPLANNGNAPMLDFAAEVIALNQTDLGNMDPDGNPIVPLADAFVGEQVELNGKAHVPQPPSSDIKDLSAQELAMKERTQAQHATNAPIFADPMVQAGLNQVMADIVPDETSAFDEMKQAFSNDN